MLKLSLALLILAAALLFSLLLIRVDAAPPPPPALTHDALMLTLNADPLVLACWQHQTGPFDPCWPTVTQAASNALGIAPSPTPPSTPMIPPPARLWEGDAALTGGGVNRSITAVGRVMQWILQED